MPEAVSGSAWPGGVSPKALDAALARFEGHVIDGKRLVSRIGPTGERVWSVEPAPKADA